MSCHVMRESSNDIIIIFFWYFFHNKMTITSRYVDITAITLLPHHCSYSKGDGKV